MYALSAAVVRPVHTSQMLTNALRERTDYLYNGKMVKAWKR